MRAVVIRSHGKVEDVVKIEEVPIRKPGSGEVLVRVYAASMNPVDYKLAEGVLGTFGPKLPTGDGLDLAGEVVEVGQGVSRFIEGDMVWGFQRVNPFQPLMGTFAEFVIINEKNIFRKPSEMSMLEGASLGVVAFTGVQALIETARLEKNQKVLILGGSGGTGSYGLQLAKHVIGAYVAVTCSTRNVELMKSLGADLVINYQEENWAQKLKGQKYDVIYDCVGGEKSWVDAALVLKSSGRYLTIVGDHAVQQALTVSNLATTGFNIASRKLGSFFGSPNYDFIMPNPSLIQYQAITKWVVSGKTKVVIDRVIPFENILEAYQYQHSGRAVGKIIVSMISLNEDLSNSIRPHVLFPNSYSSDRSRDHSNNNNNNDQNNNNNNNNNNNEDDNEEDNHHHHHGKNDDDDQDE